jgi:hypothetical protein
LNQWYNLKIELKGNNIKVFVDGVKIIDYSDPDPLESGKIAVYEEDSVAYFDDVKVYTFTCTGDLNEDLKVNIKDITIPARAWGTYCSEDTCSPFYSCYLDYSGCSYHPRWNPIADTNFDHKVNIWDVATVARVFGKDCTAHLGIVSGPILIVIVVLVILVVIFGVLNLSVKKI